MCLLDPHCVALIGHSRVRTAIFIKFSNEKLHGYPYNTRSCQDKDCCLSGLLALTQDIQKWDSSHGRCAYAEIRLVSELWIALTCLYVHALKWCSPNWLVDWKRILVIHRSKDGSVPPSLRLMRGLFLKLNMWRSTPGEADYVYMTRETFTVFKVRVDSQSRNNCYSDSSYAIINHIFSQIGSIYNCAWTTTNNPCTTTFHNLYDTSNTTALMKHMVSSFSSRLSSHLTFHKMTARSYR